MSKQANIQPFSTPRSFFTMYQKSMRPILYQYCHDHHLLIPIQPRTSDHHCKQNGDHPVQWCEFKAGCFKLVKQMYLIKKTIEPSYTFCKDIRTYSFYLRNKQYNLPKRYPFHILNILMSEEKLFIQFQMLTAAICRLQQISNIRQISKLCQISPLCIVSAESHKS